MTSTCEVKCPAWAAEGQGFHTGHQKGCTSEARRIFIQGIARILPYLMVTVRRSHVTMVLT